MEEATRKEEQEMRSDIMAVRQTDRIADRQTDRQTDKSRNLDKIDEISNAEEVV